MGPQRVLRQTSRLRDWFMSQAGISSGPHTVSLPWCRSSPRVFGPPINVNPSGVHNAFFANKLSWKFGDSGFFLKAGLGIYAPTGTQQGPNGLGNVGNPWSTF